MKTKEIRPIFLETIPPILEEGVLYVSDRYCTASHLCASGCGRKVVTPLKPGKWKLSVKDGKVTLFPSIGNWNFPCQSHYWIRANKIVPSYKFTQEEIDFVRTGDMKAVEELYDRPNWIKSLFRAIRNLLRKK